MKNILNPYQVRINRKIIKGITTIYFDFLKNKKVQVNLFKYNPELKVDNSKTLIFDDLFLWQGNSRAIVYSKDRSLIIYFSR